MSAASLARVEGISSCFSAAPFVLFYGTGKLYIRGAYAAVAMLHTECKPKYAPQLGCRCPDPDMLSSASRHHLSPEQTTAITHNNPAACFYVRQNTPTEVSRSPMAGSPGMISHQQLRYPGRFSGAQENGAGRCNRKSGR